MYNNEKIYERHFFVSLEVILVFWLPTVRKVCINCAVGAPDDHCSEQFPPEN